MAGETTSWVMLGLFLLSVVGTAVLWLLTRKLEVDDLDAQLRALELRNELLNKIEERNEEKVVCYLLDTDDV